MKKYTANEFLEIAKYDKKTNIYFAEAGGEDITITVSEGDKHRNYGLRGNGNGSITVNGSGNGSVYRHGSGDGFACRLGTGDGSACRYGSGNGYACRYGTGEGSAFKDCSRECSAFRDSIEIKSDEVKIEKAIDENLIERAAYEATCTMWVTENTPLREELAYRDGHRAGWNNAIKEMGKLIDNVKLEK